MVKSPLADRIYAVRFESQYAVASTFLRIQEHYESRRFRNRVFSLEQFMDWYAAEHGAFTYFEDWSGFNVPSEAFDAFYEGRFDPLLRKEERLLELFRRESRPFYVIGLSSRDALKHEMAHAMFHTVPAYRKAVRRALRAHDTSGIERQLMDMGYHRHVVPDEVHAYLIDTGKAPGESPGTLTALRTELRALFRQHAAAIGLRP